MLKKTLNCQNKKERTLNAKIVRNDFLNFLIIDKLKMFI